MEVDGIFVSKAEEIQNSSIVSGYVNDTGYLVLVNGAGTEINAGYVANPLFAYPVGSIYVNELSTDPAELLGGGTWARYGEGRVLVSQNSADAEFDTAGEEGGEKAHTLTVAELPPHHHTSDYPDTPASMFGTGGAPAMRSDGADRNTSDTGSGNAHNNLQPYKVVYMWKRTA